MNVKRSLYCRPDWYQVPGIHFPTGQPPGTPGPELGVVVCAWYGFSVSMRSSSAQQQQQQLLMVFIVFIVNGPRSRVDGVFKSRNLVIWYRSGTDR